MREHQTQAEFEAATLEHRAYQVVRNEVTGIFKSRRKRAGAELLEMLHDASTPELRLRAQRTWKAFDDGLAPKVDRWGGGFVRTVAQTCTIVNRPDILRELVAAGRPSWLHYPDSDVRYSALGFSVPEGDTPSDWLRALCTYRSDSNGGGWHLSLYHTAVDKELCRFPAGFIELAVDIDPDHADVEQLCESSPEGFALVMAAKMKRVIATAVAPVGTNSNIGPAPARRAARVL